MKQELYVNHSIVWLKGSTKVFTKPKKYIYIKKINTKNCKYLAYCMGLQLVGIKIKTKEHFTYKRSVKAHAKFEARQPNQPTFQNLYKRGMM